jgi:hypothetical protein
MGESAPFVLRRQGAQPRFDLLAIVSELPHPQGGDAALRMLFEWSHVTSWPFEAPNEAAVAAWGRTSPAISRAAIVHGQRLYRQAAIISALMRLGGAQVKSFHPSDYGRAMEWLERGR